MASYYPVEQKQIKPIELDAAQVRETVIQLRSVNNNELRADGAAALSLNQVGTGVAVLGGGATVIGSAVIICEATVTIIEGAVIVGAGSMLGPAILVGGIAALGIGALLQSINK
ncbi:unnamed protein product [Adineta steineri]|uniref:Uncharacterized protein n=1 Tax=Adineta steineri TaxID=433720 RepID=A0A815NTV7_9BILA|nr:unnamed protein product [Adineta steineri]CAF1438066.1 unnamed protein product [Adineta steineri]CAF1451530.1 unnamed protein product [Adineta steineri]